MTPCEGLCLYPAFTATGARRRGTLVAESEAQAAEILRGQGLFAEAITAKGARARRGGFGRRTRLNADMRAVFTRQMAVLLSSDLTAGTALETIRASGTAPEIAAIFATTGRPLPPLTQWVMGISDIVQAHALALGQWLGMGGLVLGTVPGLRVPAIRDRWHGVALRLPVVGRLMRLSAAAQYLRTLALVISSRQAVVDAAASAGEVLVIRRFRTEAEDLAEAVRRGESLSQGLARMSLVPPVCRQLIAAGEQSARLGRMTERAAVLVESWLTNERKRVSALLDPLLMLVLGAMVLVIVLAILLPIFDLQAAVG